MKFGVFGLPETFIVNSDGKIIFKHTGPLTKEIIKNEITKLFYPDSINDDFDSDIINIY